MSEEKRRELFCGVDLHSTNGVYHIDDKGGECVFHRRLENVLDIVLKMLEPFKDDLVSVAIESTYNWHWLGDALMDAEYPVVLANPAAMHQFNGLKHTDDDSDAGFIATLDRMDILPTGWICPPGERVLRDMLRRRMLMVDSRTRQALSLQSMLMRQTGSGLNRLGIETMETEELAALLKYDGLLLVAEAQLKLIAGHDEAIASLEKYVLGQCKPRAEYALLTSAPGIGKILAMVIMMEIGDISRFAGPGHLSSYVRAVKASRISNGKAKGTNNGRNGNKYLSWAFVEAVNHAIRHCAPARKWYQRKVAKTLPVVGRKALASKWSKAVWYMLTEKKPFQVELVFG